MNTTINIHLAQILFHIDSNAYDILKAYLEKLERTFANTEGKQEIIEDIEVRIAELFSEYAIREGYVISEQNVKDVIETLGSPEDIGDGEPSEDDTKTSIHKELYRDSDDRIIGGVASGLGYYFGIERVWIRLILVLLALSSFGIVVLIYVVLWAIIPEAKTTAEKLKMKGVHVNISNIEKKIRDEMGNISKRVKNVDYSKMGNSLKKNSMKFSTLVEKVVQGVFKVIGKLIGVMLLLTSSSVLIGLLFSVAIFGFVNSIDLPHEILFLTLNSHLSLWLISLLLLLSVGIPFTFMFFLGLRLLTERRKLMSNSAKYTLGIIWVATLLVIAFFIAREFRSHAFTSKTVKTEIIDIQPQDTLRIRLNDLQFESKVSVYNSIELVYNEKNELMVLEDHIRLKIIPSKDEDTKLQLERKAKGYSQREAKENAIGIEYSYDYYDGILLMDGQWVYPIEQKGQEQRVKLSIAASEGQYILISDDLSSYMNININNDQDYYRRKIAGHLWKMENGLLKCQDCKPLEGSFNLDNDELKLNVSDEDNSFELSINEEGIQIKNE